MTSPSKANPVLLGLEWALLMGALAAFTITEAYTIYVTAGLILLVGSFLLRALRTQIVIPRTGLEIPWALGLLSAAVAVWIAYNQPVALLQFYRLLAACVLYYAVVATGKDSLRWPAAVFLSAAAVLALYWPTQNDFAMQPGKLAVITQLGKAINQALPAIPGPDIHSNVAAGTLVVALPFGAAFVLDAWRRGQRWLSGLAAVLTLVVLGGLFMTSSRGAWLALGGVCLLAVLAWQQRRMVRNSSPNSGKRKQLVFWAAIGLIALLAVGIVVLSGNFDRLVGQIPDPNGGMQVRTRLWQQGWQVARDYPFTGSGLMSFWMVHATYNLLIHTPFIAHAHNTFLEVWVEQGVLGFIGLVLAGLVVFAWAWKTLGRQSVSIWGWAGLAALTAATLHGLVDVVFYVTRTLPVIGLLFGYAWFLNSDVDALQDPEAKGRRREKGWTALAVALIGLAIAILFLRRPLTSAVYANLGAIQQSRLELTRYDPVTFDKYSMDQVRKDSYQAGDLKPALTSFSEALVYEPTNRTALQREAQIALSLGDYPAALSDSQRLWLAGYRDEVTRLLYGDALIADGQVEAGVEAVRGLTWAKTRLLGQAWARYWVNQDYQRAADAWKAVLLLDPQAEGIESWLEQALAKLQ